MHTDSTRARFASKRTTPATGCWLWTAALFENGYGAFRVGKKQRKAHVVAWEIATGKPVPSEMLVCHTCDNRACVNYRGIGVYFVRGVAYPRRGHLWLGTWEANQSDMTDKGRGRTGDRNGTRTKPESLQREADHWTARMPERIASGERSGRVLHPESYEHLKGATRPPEANTRGVGVWTAKLDDAAVTEMRALFAQGASIRNLMQRYGLKRDAVVRAVHRITWSHVP